LPIGSSVPVHLVSTGSPDPPQRPFEPGIRPYPTVPGTIRRRCQHSGSRLPAALSAVGLRFLGHPAPAGELNLPHGRPTGIKPPDPIGVVVLHMSKLRPGRTPPLPRGRWCAPGQRLSSGRHPPLCRGQSLRPRCNIPSAGVTFTRRHQGFTCVRPSPQTAGCRPGPGSILASRRSSPRLRPPDGTGAPWALTPGFAPRSHPRRTPRRRQAMRTGPGTTPPASAEPPSVPPTCTHAPSRRT
jgi:hypothetical protein